MVEKQGGGRLQGRSDLSGNCLKSSGSSGQQGLDSGCEWQGRGQGCTWGGEHVANAPRILWEAWCQLPPWLSSLGLQPGILANPEIHRAEGSATTWSRRGMSCPQFWWTELPLGGRGLLISTSPGQPSWRPPPPGPCGRSLVFGAVLEPLGGACAVGGGGRLEGLRDRPTCPQGLFDNFLRLRLRDSSLGTVCVALDWLAFDDLLGRAAHHGQNFQLLRYLPFLPPAFHLLFATSHVPRIAFPSSQQEVRPRPAHAQGLVQGSWVTRSWFTCPRPRTE